MSSHYKIFLILSLILGLSYMGRAQSSKKKEKLQLSLYVDTSARMSLEDIREQSSFQKTSTTSLNFGFSSSAYWLRVKTPTALFRNGDIFLQIGNPLLEEITCYQKNKQGNWQKTLIGNPVEVAEQANYIWHRLPVLRLNPSDTLLYLRIYNPRGRVQIPLTWYSDTQFYQQAQANALLYGGFFGLLLLVILNNVFIFSAIRELSYFFYVLYTLSVSAVLATLSGHIFQFLPWIRDFNPYQVLSFFIFLTHCFGVSFAIYYLELRRSTPRLYPLFIAFLGLNVLLFLASFLLREWASIINVMINIIGVVLSLLAIMIASLAWLRGVKNARYYVISYLILMLGAAFLILGVTNVLPPSFISAHGLELGVLGEAITLSIALADKQRLSNLEKKEAQDRLIELQKEANQSLEKKVQARTQQLVEANEEIASQRDALEEKSQQITASITYASRIQNAMLPHQEKIQQLLPECFIFYQPRDIVSGDFYWFAEQEGQIIIAAVDCTGHGVPGAFMSMIGNDLLDYIVNEKKITQADEILNQLDMRIKRALNQQETQNQDGMDLALCVIDQKAEQMQFAGAKNPLIYIQPDKEGKPQLFRIKGDKRPVGGLQPVSQSSFTKHRVDVSLPTTFYLYSDGFQDQFGGAKGKKFMALRFRKLLFDIHQEPMETQKKILQKTLNDWKANHIQVDDILVMGIRL